MGRPSDEVENTEAPHHIMCGTLKIPHWSKVIHNEGLHFTVFHRKWWRLLVNEIHVLSCSTETIIQSINYFWRLVTEYLNKVSPGSTLLSWVRWNIKDVQIYFCVSTFSGLSEWEMLSINIIFNKNINLIIQKYNYIWNQPISIYARIHIYFEIIA